MTIKESSSSHPALRGTQVFERANTSRRRDETTRSKVGNHIGTVLLAGAMAAGSIGGIVVIGKRLNNEIPGAATNNETTIVKVDSPLGSVKDTANGVYQITVGENGTVSKAVANVAAGEGENLNSQSVKTAIYKESNHIQTLVDDGKLSPSSNGVVTAETQFDVVAAHPIIDQAPLSNPPETIQRVSSL